MNITTLFRSPFESAPQISKDYQLDTFLDSSTIPELSNEVDCPYLFQVLAKGTSKAYTPWCFDMLPTKNYLLLYTKKGTGTIEFSGSGQTLAENTLLLFDCNQKYKIQISSSVWEYQVFILQGQGFAGLQSLIPPSGILLHNAGAPSLCHAYLEQLEPLCYQKTVRCRLQIDDLVHRILTLCLLSSQETEPQKTSESMELIKDFLDHEYAKEHSLDELEDKFHVSKYRICHEFKESFQMSPLQYLNWRRIEEAKILLSSTSYKIYEIGIMVGIENTNHFINLFKKYNCITPLEYKKRMAF